MNTSMRLGAPNAGSALIELLIAATLAMLVFGGLASLTDTGSGAFEARMAGNELESQSRTALGRIGAELAEAGASTLVPSPDAPLGSATLDFRCNVGWDGTAVQWGPVMRIAYEPAEGELDNGLDDDGDGLVDEGLVALTRNPGQADELHAVFARDVRGMLAGEIPNGLDDNGNGLIDERGLSFDRDGDVLNVRLTLERVEPDGEIVRRTVESSILLRN